MPSLTGEGGAVLMPSSYLPSVTGTTVKGPRQPELLSVADFHHPFCLTSSRGPQGLCRPHHHLQPSACRDALGISWRRTKPSSAETDADTAHSGLRDSAGPLTD